MAVAPARTHPRGTPTPLVWMVLTAVVLIAALALILIWHDATNPSVAQITGSGVAATEARPLPNFSDVSLAVGANVSIRSADKAVAVVRTDDNLVDRITTRVRDGMLIVGSVGHFTTRTPLTVAIGVPQLTGLTISHGGSVRLHNINGRHLAVTLSGLGGAVRASGAVDRLDVALRTFGNAELKALTAGDVRAVLSGSGQIVVTATHKLDASLSGSGAIVYYGNPPQMHKTVLGSGSVTPG
jgi:Putative auto-transporter adhesin, head GIN domain